jgi:hypothetical protein
MIAILVLVGSLAAAAGAQTVRHAQVRVSIPFQFNAGNTTMPAGDYLVRQLNTDSGAATLQLSRKDGSANVIINMIGSIGDGQAMTNVLFRRYGDQYYFGKFGLTVIKTDCRRRDRKRNAPRNRNWQRCWFRWRP